LPYLPVIESMIAHHPDRLTVVYRGPVDPVAGPLRPLTLYRVGRPDLDSNGH
jgi:hypothetical protein